jgi:hypothetical protein
MPRRGRSKRRANGLPRPPRKATAAEVRARRGARLRRVGSHRCGGPGEGLQPSLPGHARGDGFGRVLFHKPDLLSPLHAAQVS